VANNSLDVHAAAYRGGSLYDFDNQVILNWYPERVLKRVKSAGSLLELGLGHGFTVEKFAPHFARHVVVDGSPAVIRDFREKVPNCRAEIVAAMFEEYRTSDPFDVILMGFILEHVDDPMVILRRYREFLAPHGRMFLAVPNANALNRRLGNLAGMLDDVYALSPNDLALGHKRYYTVESLREQIDRAGYRLIGLEGIYLKPLTSGQLASLKLDGSIIRALCEVGIDYPELSCGILAEISLA
jgi:2-polyprenyl-3-methyl-5-hydroxy-6-metoxy-1,4-benzoquinol methylase